MSKRNRAVATTAAIGAILASTAAPASAPVATPAVSRPDSIRSTIRTALLAGETTEQITVTLKAKFPTSKAAEKSAKHIAFYRSKLRKEGLLAPRAVSVAVTAPVAE